MNAASLVTPQGFIAGFNDFVSTQAMVPMQPIRMEGEDVVYNSPVDGVIPPPASLISLDGSYPDEKGLPESWPTRVELGDGANRVGGDKSFLSEWRRLIKLVEDDVYRLAKGGGNDAWESRVRVNRAIALKGRANALVVGDDMLRVAVNFTNLEIDQGRKDPADLVYRAARVFGISLEHTASAIVSELTANMEVDRHYYSGKAADSWLHSLAEYDDPATARFRLSRGIIHSSRFFNRTTAVGLYEASAALYLDDGHRLNAAFDYLRMVGALITGGEVAKSEWAGVETALRVATGLFMELNVDIESGGAATLAHAAGKLAGGAA